MLHVETFFIPGDVNMAFDVNMGFLSKELKEPILRIYTWERPTLSLGRHQKVEDVDFEKLEELSVDCVRRPTGGRAVLHWDEITYSVAFPRGSEEFSLGVMKLYERISGILFEAFERLGVRVSFSGGKSWDPKSPSCFSSGARYELKVDGKKLVGSAQVRMKDFVLQHGSIMMRPSWEILSAVLSSHPTVEFLSRKAVGLREVLDVRFRDVVDAILESFDEKYGLRWMDQSEILNLLKKSEKMRGGFSCQSST